MRRRLVPLVLLAATIAAHATSARGDDWPRWRGRDGNATAAESLLPVHWSTSEGVRWKVPLPGSGSSSPITWGKRVFVTSAEHAGTARRLHALDLTTGAMLWTVELEDDFPEPTNVLTGHAAATPVTDGRHVVAFFGNAGVVCCDLDGHELWRKRFDYFDTELGLASSPILDGDHVILVCDHDGNRFQDFDSFLVALDVATGEERWRADRPKLYRSWSTPILVPAGDGARELVVNAQDELRGYDPRDGSQLWNVTGMTLWVAPSPVFAQGLIFATSGRDGPAMAVRPGGRGDVTESHVAWQHPLGGPYVCSPVVVGRELYIHDEAGVLVCYEAATGRVHYRQRLAGKFTASSVAGAGKVYFTNEAGTMYVVAAGPKYELLAKNQLEEETLASPAIADGVILLRTLTRLYAIEGTADVPGMAP